MACPGRSGTAGSTSDNQPPLKLRRSAEALAKAEAEPDESARGSTILVVEDNPDMVQFIAAALRPEYVVRTAASGQEGLDLALQETPDLIITDLMMPGMSGADLLNALRDRPLFSGVPVLVLTARAEDELRVDLLRAGAQDYLVKPFAVEELRVRVRNLLMVKDTRQALQQALASTEHDLAELTRAHIARARELETARAQAESASRMKDEFLAIVSHELRTPLTSILGWAGMLRKRGELDPSIAERAFESIERNARTQKHLIEDLLDVSGIAAGRLGVQMDMIPLSEVIERAIDAIQPAADEKAIRLSVSLQSSTLVRADGQRLEQAACNLLSNAVKFTPTGGAVHVSVTEEGGSAILRVSDTGPGSDTRLTGARVRPVLAEGAVRQPPIMEGSGSVSRSCATSSTFMAAAWTLTAPAAEAAALSRSGCPHSPACRPAVKVITSRMLKRTTTQRPQRLRKNSMRSQRVLR